MIRVPIFPRKFCQILQFNLWNSAVQFVKFCEILQHHYPQIPYIPRPVGIVVLTDNTSKYKEFIVTCNTRTHYIRPLMMKISSWICHNYNKSKLTTTRFYCFINGKIKKEPEKPWIRYKCGKKEAIPCGKQQIPWQTANSAVRCENLSAAEYRLPWWWQWWWSKRKADCLLLLQSSSSSVMNSGHVLHDESL